MQFSITASIVILTAFNIAVILGIHCQLLKTAYLGHKVTQVYNNNTVTGELYKTFGICLNHGLKVESACGYPKYTNYVPAFKECIDYIFYEKEHLYVESVVPLPAEEILTAYGDGLPSKVFPSDHLPLICQLAWH